MSQWADKRCGTCGWVKPVDEFPARPASEGGGPRSICKSCRAAKVRDQRRRNPERYRQQARERYRKNAAQIKARSAEYKRQNREKSRAHSAVEYALKTGKLTRPELCESCGKAARVVAHHPDYSERLSVVWLCSVCHQMLHRHVEVAA